jgi:hypothetical protein
MMIMMAAAQQTRTSLSLSAQQTRTSLSLSLSAGFILRTLSRIDGTVATVPGHGPSRRAGPGQDLSSLSISRAGGRGIAAAWQRPAGRVPPPLKP